MSTTHWDCTARRGEGAHVVKRKGQPDEQKYDLPMDGFFLAIGRKPNTDVFKGGWIWTRLAISR